MLETFDAQGRIKRVDDVPAVIALALGDALQEGVLGGSSAAPIPPVSRLSASQVHVPGDTAWIDGDGVNGLTGRYRVTWPDVDLAVPAAGAPNFRAHRITVPVPAGGHGASAAVVRSGVDDPAANLDSMTSIAGTNGAPALPGGELQLASVISDSGGIDPNGVRERRRYARGYRHRYRRTGSSGNSVVSASPQPLWAGAADFRFEGNSNNILEIGLDGHFRAPSTAYYSIWLSLGDPATTGFWLHEWRIPQGFDGWKSLRLPITQTSGSSLYRLWHSTSVSGTTGLILVDPVVPLYAYAWAREIPAGYLPTPVVGP